MQLSKEECNSIFYALQMRRNYIETGTVTLSANDAAMSDQKHLIRALSEHQKSLIGHIDNLCDKLLEGFDGKDEGEEHTQVY